MARTAPFQLLVNIENEERFLNPLVVPRIFKNKLSENCESISLIDKRGRRYSSCVVDAGYGKVRLCDGRWNAFVADNILIDRGINKLCFTMITPMEFEVTCFDNDGMETSRDYRGKLIYNKHVFKATDTTMIKENIPFEILKDLNEKSLRKPIRTANLQGNRQHASNVLVIYEWYTTRRNMQRYHAVGFEGKQWTNFCVENNIEDGCSVILTNLRNGNFKIDVFNEKGVILGIEDDSHHSCRVEEHRHMSSMPSFKIQFKDHTLRSKTITVPGPFVEKHNLHIYEGMAFLMYGNVKFVAELIMKKDRRRPNQLNHLVMKRDWVKFFDEAGLSVGNRIRFEFMKEESENAGMAVFNVC